MSEASVVITVFDTESDGLYEEATKVWCAVTYNNLGSVCRFDPDHIDHFLSTITDSDIIVAHNVLDHDLPLMEKVLGYKYEGIVVDTLVLSRMLNPERVGGHSIDAWGERFGIPKPKHEDWSQYSEEMLYRCTEDTRINYRLLYHLMEEGGLVEEDLCELPMY